MKYAFWNNKGGTGKTSLAFQTMTEYAILNSHKKILAIDLCPQANLSELLMGGLLGKGGDNLNILCAASQARSIGGYFQTRLSSPYRPDIKNARQYVSIPNKYNSNIPDNIDLIAGDRIVELQSNSISALSITQIPGVNTYIMVVDWVNDLIDSLKEEKEYDDIFIDTNPSFAIYTQIALAASERLIVPVMADDSSRRALSNVFSLIYGLSLPSAVYNDYSFNKKLSEAHKDLPKIHLIIKNRLTQYMGPASAYGSVLSSIDEDILNNLDTNPECFTFNKPADGKLIDGLVDVRDFQTTGVVAFAEGTPFSNMRTGNHNIFGKVTQIQQQNLDNCINCIRQITKNIV